MAKSCWKPLVSAPNRIASNVKVESNRRQKCLQVREKTIHYDLFIDVLSSRGYIRKNVTQIQSQQLQLLATQINKIAMSAFDDKRCILENGIQSFAYGHYSLESSSTFCKCTFWFH